MNKDVCLVVRGGTPAASSRCRAERERVLVEARVQARIRRRRRRGGPGARRLPSRATPTFHYLAA
jgi:hypothetical protein